MENNHSESSQSKTSKIATAVFLFCYFGFVMIPGWINPFSALFLLWLILLPIVIITLLGVGIRGGIGLQREKSQKAAPNPQNKYFVWLASLGTLWFVISISLAYLTNFAYYHTRFDSEIWKNMNWGYWDYANRSQLSPRERMLEDLMNNVLPGRTITEIIELLGQPDETRDFEGEETFFYYTGWNIMEPKCLFINFDDHEIIKEYDRSLCG